MKGLLGRTPIPLGLALVLLTLAPAPAGAVPAAAPTEPSVQTAQARLASARAAAQAAVLTFLAAEDRLGRVDKNIAGLQHRIPVLTREIASLRDVIGRRAAVLYRGGNRTDLLAVGQVLASSDVIAAARTAHFAGIAQHETDAHADSLAQRRTALRDARRQLREERARQVVLVELARRRSDEVKVTMERASAELRKAEQREAEQKYLFALAVQHAQQAALAEAAVAAGLPPPPPPVDQIPLADPALAAKIPTEHLRCPVAGATTFANDFGQPRSGWRVHQGTDMFALRGTPNVAVGNGTARPQVGGLGGNAIWLYTDDGNAYYYAHLDHFEGTFDGPNGGRRVVQGDVVGYSGNTGNAAGGPVHTHFEIHPQRSGPINPFPILREMCKTEAGTG